MVSACAVVLVLTITVRAPHGVGGVADGRRRAPSSRGRLRWCINAPAHGRPPAPETTDRHGQPRRHRVHLHLDRRIFRMSLASSRLQRRQYEATSRCHSSRRRRASTNTSPSRSDRSGRRVLDLAAGGGAARLRARRGAEGVGVALSSAQVAACRRHGSTSTSRTRAPSTRQLWLFDASRASAWSTSARRRSTRRAPGGDLRLAVRTRRRRAASGRRFYLQTMCLGAR